MRAILLSLAIIGSAATATCAAQVTVALGVSLNAGTLSAHDGDQYFTVPAGYIPGDPDGDGDIDGDDIAIWSQNFTGSLAPGTGTATIAMGDFDGDRDVDGDDAAIWSQNFTGSHAPGGVDLSAAVASVPEPTSLGLLGIIGLAFLGRRSRKA